MLDPAGMSPGSIMPAYPWLYEQSIDKSSTAAKIGALRTIGVPYEDGYEDKAVSDLDKQSAEITGRLQKEGYEISSDAEIVALIAYLQRLGKDIKVERNLQSKN